MYYESKTSFCYTLYKANDAVSILILHASNIKY